jgi:hypothetical protein
MTKGDMITALKTIYALCAIKARNAKDLDEVIETWKVAVQVSEMVIEATEGLQIAQDYLREAKERLENAQEEKRVETEVAPEVWDKIFPKL